MEKVRLNKKRCQSGMDGMELVLKLENMENLYLPREELKNTAGNTIVSMECVGGVVKAYVNAVHGVRSDNVQPYGCWGIADVPGGQMKLVCGAVSVAAKGERRKPCLEPDKSFLRARCEIAHPRVRKRF